MHSDQGVLVPDPGWPRLGEHLRGRRIEGPTLPHGRNHTRDGAVRSLPAKKPKSKGCSERVNGGGLSAPAPLAQNHTVARAREKAPLP